VVLHEGPTVGSVVARRLGGESLPCGDGQGKAGAVGDWHAGGMSDRVVVTVEAGVADVRLNRPDKLNALDPSMFTGIVEAGEELKHDRSVRAVVLSGEGRGFCAGLDLSSFEAMAGDGEPGAGDGPATRSPGRGIMETNDRITHLGQQAAWVWQELEVPVIAAIHGPALGGGFQIAMGADLRVVAPDAKLSVLEIRWGLIPDMTGTLMLPRVVGLEVAKDLTFTGRMVSGEEAVQLGLASRLSETPHDDAIALARDLAGKSPDALAHAKRLLNLSGTRPVAEQFLDERTAMASLIGSPNQVEATMAYLEKRTPRFT
jgi:enoyl-CoA hydratase/carnithine racemase